MDVRGLRHAKGARRAPSHGNVWRDVGYEFDEETGSSLGAGGGVVVDV
jgi:hypothetical protein